MRICIPLMMIAITFSVAALSVPASPRAMQKISTKYSLTQALRDGAQQMSNYSWSSGEILEDMIGWLGDSKHMLEHAEHKDQIRKLMTNINKHREAQSFINEETVANIKTLIDAQEVEGQTFTNALFQQLHDALKAEVAAEGLLKEVAQRLLDSGKHDLLFGELLVPNATANEQMRIVLREVADKHEFTRVIREELEELFTAAQKVVEKRNTAVTAALADKERSSFYAFRVERNPDELLAEDGTPFANASNIITFGETKNGVEERVKQQSKGRGIVVNKDKLPKGRVHLDRIVMKILALTSNFRKVDFIRVDGTKDVESFVIVDGDGRIKNLAAEEEEHVEAEVARALDIVDNYFYKSFFSAKIIRPHPELPKLHLAGAARLEFTKSNIMAVLQNAEDPVQVFAGYGVRLGDKLARVRLAELYRAKKALRDELSADVMKGIDAKFRKLLEGEYNLVGRGKARTISFAEIERQAAVLNLIDVTGDEFAEVRFDVFISGRSDLPQAVHKFFSDVQRTPEQLVVWKRLQLLDEERKAVRRSSYSFAKEDIIATLRSAEDPVQVFAGYGVRLSDGLARVRLAELYRAKKAVSRELDDEVVGKIDVNFNALLAQEYNLNGKGARTISFAEIERQAAVLDIIDVTIDATEVNFAEGRFNYFISGSQGLPQAVRKFFSDGQRTPEQLVVWERLQQLDEERKAVRRSSYSFAKEDIIATLRSAETEEEGAQVIADYGTQLNKYARKQLAELYRAKKAVSRELDDEVMKGIDAKFSELLEGEYNLNGKGARTISFAEIERQAAVLDLIDVTGDEFAEVRFDEFISGRHDLPQAVRKFFSGAGRTPEQLVVWERLQQLDKQRKAVRRSSYSFAKEDIIATLRSAEDPVQVFAGYGVRLSDGLARVRLAELYRAKKAVSRELDDEVMKGIDAKLSKLLDGKYNLNGKGARTISFAEIERQAAVLDLIDVTGDEFAEVRFGKFISGEMGIPEAVRDFFSEAERTGEQLKVWDRLRRYSFAKEDIMSVLRNAEDPVQVFAGYGVRLSDGLARVRLAELYRAKKAVSRELDDEVMKGIDAKLSKLLDGKYNLNGKGARTISFAEIERQAAVLDLIDVTGNEFARGSFGDFISGRSDLPQAVRDFFSVVRTDEQPKIWERLQLLDKQRKAVRRSSYSFAKEDIIATLRSAEDPVQVFAGYGVRLSDGLARVRLAELYRAKKAVSRELDDEVMKGIDAKLSKLLDGKYNLSSRGEARTMPLAEIEKQAAVLDLIDVTKFDKAIFGKFISGEMGIPEAVRDFSVGQGGLVSN